MIQKSYEREALSGLRERWTEMVYKKIKVHEKQSPLSEDLFQQPEDLWYVQLNVFQVQKMFVVLLLIRTKGVSAQYEYKEEFANLFQKVVNLKIHLQDSLLTALVVQGDDERPRSRRSDIEENVRTTGGPVQVSRAVIGNGRKGHTDYPEHYSRR